MQRNILPPLQDRQYKEMIIIIIDYYYYYYSPQDRQYLLLVAADTPGQNMTQFIPEVSKFCILQQMKE